VEDDGIGFEEHYAKSSSRHLSGCMEKPSMKAQAWAWQSAKKLLSAMGDRFLLKANLVRGPHLR